MKVEIMNVAEVNAETMEQGLSFKRITKEEGAVYGLLCPRVSRRTAESILKDLDIPERVKELVEMTKDRFRNYDVWEAESYQVKDPIIIGRQAQQGSNGQYDFYDEQYLLARWGEELEPFNLLYQKAKDLVKKRSKLALIRAKAEIDSRLLDLDAFIEDAFSRGENEIPKFDLGALK